ncbi:MAG: GH116 family glycosyl hydrolase [Planctomycetota bacterium]
MDILGRERIDIDHIVMSDEPLVKPQLMGLGQNRNRVLTESGTTILHMTSDKNNNAVGYGDMALIVLESKATATASWDSPDALRKDWSADGALSGIEEAGPSPAGQTLNGALAVPLLLGPGQERTLSFALTWYFPNAAHGDKRQEWQQKGNMYTNWWSDALDVARYLNKHLDRLTRLTHLYHETLYASNLPHWLLDRVSSQVAVLRSKTCFWDKSGYFGAWEGCSRGTGCCHGNCAHVWHYAQAHARLFPSIARRMREQSLRYQRYEGGIPFRHPTGKVAFDGQCGEILGGYREHLCSADRRWTDKHWPQYKKAMDYIIARWDEDEDGILAGPQHNTLDGELGGSTTWLGSLYLAALAASEKMAELQGNGVVAARYRRIRQSGATKQNETLWNGEYYIQIPDPEPERDYNNGCHIDQVLGEWWANQIGTERHYPAGQVRSAMQSLLKYNFRTNFRGVKQVPRKFVDDNDAGMQMITWPKGPRPTKHIQYADEAMTGFEYAAAATMVQYGMLREGFKVTKAIYDRYDGRLRTGLTKTNWASWGYSGNPFGDDECGKFYARAMSVWSILLACQGFIYDGPAGVIGFKPIWQSDDHISFFTSAEGWGLFTQKHSKQTQTEQIEVKYGKLKVHKLLLELPEGVKPVEVTALLDNQKVTSSFTLEGHTLQLTFAKLIVLGAGSALKVNVKVR